MKLSIIIPAYNVENYIKDCLDSIISQKADDYEIILVDDGSTDLTGKICDEYAEKYSQCKVFHKENGGLSHTRNYGVEKATGEYIMFVDSDDFVISETLHHILEFINKKPQVTVFNYQTYDNKIVNNNCHNLSEFKSDEFITGKEYLKKALQDNLLYGWYAWLYCINKEYYLNNKYEFEVGKEYEDVRLTYRILLNAEKISVLNKDVYSYRVNRVGAITQMKTLKSMLDYLDMTDTNTKEITAIDNIDDVRTLLLNNISYSYYVGLIWYFKYNTTERSQLLKRLKETKYIINNTITGSQKYVRYLIKIIGIRPTAALLYLRAKISGKL